MHEPDLSEVPLLTVLQALADEHRLSIVRGLRDGGELMCGTFLPQVSKATRSHHLKVLREAGLTRTRVEGTAKYVRLRLDELDERFPGLVSSVLREDRAATAR
jgi:DNA-binding transcriptional ArsR family regulator